MLDEVRLNPEQNSVNIAERLHFSFDKRAVGWVSLENIVYSKAKDCHLRIVKRTDLRKFVFFLVGVQRQRYFVLGMRRRLAMLTLVLCIVYVIVPAMTSSFHEHEQTANSRSISKNPTKKTGER